jgi:hypothetical protein
MSKSFHAYDITGFIDSSIGSYLSEIETYAIEMSQTDDKEERINLMNDIQYIIEQCKEVMR